MGRASQLGRMLDLGQSGWEQWQESLICAQSITTHGIPCHYNTRIGVGKPFRYYAKSNGKKNDHEFP